jgi:glucokinase
VKTIVTPPTRLVADIGGTNTRIGLFDSHSGTLRAVKSYTNRDYPGLEDIVDHWLASLEEPAPEACCVAVAAPLATDQVSMINIDWSFSRREFAGRFGFRRAAWLNDFEAIAYALPHLAADQRHGLQIGRDGAAGNLAAVGPGTGLGGATLQWCSGQPRANASEPGHMGLSPATAEEVELFRLLVSGRGEVYAELLVSGPGLQRIYQTLGEVRGETVDTALTPADISDRGRTGEDPLCRASLGMFCALLGSVCGDFVLANGAYGGLYVAGGIAPRMIDFLEDSDFRQRFRSKGALEALMETVPIYVVTATQPGLIGASHAPLAKQGIGQV